MRVIWDIVCAGILGMWTVAPLFAADPPGGAIKLEISALSGFERHRVLLAQPGYMAIALENNGLSPSLSSRLKVSDVGRSVEMRSAVLGYAGTNGAVYSYEAGIMLGIGDSKLTFPVVVDTSGLGSGKVTVTLSPPLAGLIPGEITDRIRLKVQMLANPSAQKAMLDYLEGLAKAARPTDDGSSMVEAILLDAYNKGGGPERLGGREAGDAVPLSEQWLLILTLSIWLVIVPVVLVVQRLRRRVAPV